MRCSYPVNNTDTDIDFDRDISSHDFNITSFITEDNSLTIKSSSSSVASDMRHFGTINSSTSNIFDTFSRIDGIKSEQQPISFDSDVSDGIKTDRIKFVEIQPNLNNTVKVLSGFKNNFSPARDCEWGDNFRRKMRKKKKNRDREKKFKRIHGVSGYTEFGAMFE